MIFHSEVCHEPRKMEEVTMRMMEDDKVSRDEDNGGC